MAETLGMAQLGEARAIHYMQQHLTRPSLGPLNAAGELVGGLSTAGHIKVHREGSVSPSQAEGILKPLAGIAHTLGAQDGFVSRTMLPMGLSAHAGSPGETPSEMTLTW